MKPRPRGYWHDWNNTKRELEDAIQANNGEFPTRKKLKEMGRAYVMTGIRHHGGIAAVRVQLGYSETKPQDLGDERKEEIQ